jgi:hypothetical protein
LHKKLIGNTKEKITQPQYTWHDPQVGFTDNQWYYHQAHHTVFFSAFSKEETDKDTLISLAKNLITLAPQLLAGFDNVKDAKDFPEEILAKICSIKMVDSFDNHPNEWDFEGRDIFSSINLPLFRLKAVIRKNGADAQGRHAMILMLSTHALIEGADASLLTSSKMSKQLCEDKLKKAPFLTRVYYKVIASFIAPLQVLAAEISVSKKHDVENMSFVIDNKKLRRIAKSLNISRRTLMFASVAYALNDDGKAFSKRNISIVYTDMDTVRDYTINTDYFKFHAMSAKFKVKENFKAFVQNAANSLEHEETKNPNASQDFLDAIFGAHRFFKKYIPFIYSDKTFRFSAGYHLNLSLTPPQRLNGSFTKKLIEPVYCGAMNPGLNVCVFVPGRTQTSFNFAMSKRHLKNVYKVEALLNDLDKGLKD